MRSRTPNGRRLLLLAFSAHASSALAGADFKIDTDALRDPGELEFELHATYFVAGRMREPGLAAADRLLRLAPGLGYGVAPGFDVGIQLFTATSSETVLRGDGGRVEVKYVPPALRGAPVYWGLALEAGRPPRSVSAASAEAELKGIFGVRTGAWAAVLNPALGWAIAGKGRSGTPEAELNGKLARRTSDHASLGLEAYATLGPLNDLGRLRRRPQYLFAAIDLGLRGLEISCGLGRGLTRESDRWVWKLMLGIPFD